MKNSLTALLGGALMLGSAISAQAAEVAGNVTIASDYSFRGVSQTDRDPAIQGGFDLGFDSGFYLGTWGSNISGFEDTTMEWDLYGGYAADINDDWSYDLRYIRYEYPGNGETYDYNEYHAFVSYKDLTLGVGYSDEYFALKNTSWVYPNVAYTIGLPAEASLVFKVGLSMTDDDDDLFTEAFGDDDVLDWSVMYSIPVAGVSLSVGVVGTDIDDEDCLGDTDLCETRAIVSVSKSM